RRRHTRFSRDWSSDVCSSDLAPVVDGFAMTAGRETPTLPIEAAWDEEYEGGSMRDLTEEQLATFRSRAVPQPGRTVTEPVRLTDPRRLAVPGTVVCTAFSSDDYRSYAEQGVPFLAGLRDHTALRLVDLPTGHWPMWSRPAEPQDRKSTRLNSSHVNIS